MTVARNILVGTAALVLISSAVFAQQDLTGMITKIDRINGTVTIQEALSASSTPNAGNVAKEFKAQKGVSLDDVHAGDKVTLAITETGEMKSITKTKD